MAGQLTDYRAKQHDRAREGLFIGPELGLEFRAVKLKSNELSIFYKIHSGFGFMHEKLNDYEYNPRFTVDPDKIYPESLGSIMVGINYRQKIYDNCRFRSDLEVHSTQQRQCGSTGKQPAIGSYIYFRTL